MRGGGGVLELSCCVYVQETALYDLNLTPRLTRSIWYRTPGIGVVVLCLCPRDCFIRSKPDT